MKMGLPVLLVLFLGSPFLAHGHAYPKLSMPRNEIAVLSNPKDSSIDVIRIDGKPVGFNTHGEFELLPGRHFLSVELLFIKHHVQYASQIMDLVLDAKAGSELKVACSHQENEVMTKIREETDNTGSFKVWVEENPSGRKISSFVGHWGQWNIWIESLDNKVLFLELGNLNDKIIENVIKQDKVIQEVKKLGVEEVAFLDKISAQVWRAKLQEGKLELYTRPD